MKSHSVLNNQNMCPDVGRWNMRKCSIVIFRIGEYYMKGDGV